MPAVQDLLERIRKRPGIYLGECSLSALYYTIAGYVLALGVHGIHDDRNFQLPDDFNDWVAYRLHYKESTSGWRNMILGVSENEAAAFDRFFKLLDEHMTRRPRVVAKVIGLEKTYSIGPEGRERIERYPNRISLIAYTDDPGFFIASDEPGYSLPEEEFFPCLDWFETFTGISRSQLTIYDAKTFEQWNSDKGL